MDEVYFWADTVNRIECTIVILMLCMLCVVLIYLVRLTKTLLAVKEPSIRYSSKQLLV